MELLPDIIIKIDNKEQIHTFERIIWRVTTFPLFRIIPYNAVLLALPKTLIIISTQFFKTAMDQNLQP